MLSKRDLLEQPRRQTHTQPRIHPPSQSLPFPSSRPPVSRPQSMSGSTSLLPPPFTVRTYQKTRDRRTGACIQRDRVAVRKRGEETPGLRGRAIPWRMNGTPPHQPPPQTVRDPLMGEGVRFRDGDGRAHGRCGWPVQWVGLRGGDTVSLALTPVSIGRPCRHPW